MKGVQGYENVRSRIDDAEGQAMRKIGNVMSKMGEVRGKLQDQNVNLNRFSFV